MRISDWSSDMCSSDLMGTDDASVVDTRLRVRGVKGLRVVDISVMPSLVSGNTNAPAMAMASRAGELNLADAHLGSRDSCGEQRGLAGGSTCLALSGCRPRPCRTSRRPPRPLHQNPKTEE